MAKRQTMAEVLQAKENLAVEIATLQLTIHNKEVQDEALRREFVKAFGWGHSGIMGVAGSRNSFYNSDRSEKLPTWTEIFVEIVKLKATKEFRDFQSRVDGLEQVVRDAERARYEGETVKSWRRK